MNIYKTLLCAGLATLLIFIILTKQLLRPNLVPYKNVSKTEPTTDSGFQNGLEKESCEDLMSRSSGQYSVLQLLTTDPLTNAVTVLVTTADMLNRKKNYGGDVIYIWSEQDQTKTRGTFKRAVGSVEDLNNGSYLGSIQIPWSGPTKIKAKIASKLGNTCRRFQSIAKYGNAVFATNTPFGIHYKFKNKLGSETTRCSPIDFIYGYDRLCNYTDSNFGLSWFCGRPSQYGLTCSDISVYGVVPIDKSKIIPYQPMSEIIQGRITEVLRQSAVVDFETPIEKPKEARPKYCYQKPKLSWTKVQSGYGVDRRWISTQCENIFVINKENIMQCISNKTIFAFGDSTFQQYMELISRVVGVKFDLEPGNLTRHVYHSNSSLPIDYSFRKHERPFHAHGLKYDPFNFKSVAQEIINFAENPKISGQDLIIGVQYNSHLSAFPVSVFRGRLQRLVPAIKYLVDRKPGVKILFKGPHHCSDERKWFDARVNYIYRDILFEEFAKVQDFVIYLDTLSITIAYNSELLHPQGDVLYALVSQFLSYICFP